MSLYAINNALTKTLNIKKIKSLIINTILVFTSIINIIIYLIKILEEQSESKLQELKVCDEARYCSSYKKYLPSKYLLLGFHGFNGSSLFLLAS